MPRSPSAVRYAPPEHTANHRSFPSPKRVSCFPSRLVIPERGSARSSHAVVQPPLLALPSALRALDKPYCPVRRQSAAFPAACEPARPRHIQPALFQSSALQRLTPRWQSLQCSAELANAEGLRESGFGWRCQCICVWRLAQQRYHIALAGTTHPGPQRGLQLGSVRPLRSRVNY